MIGEIEQDARETARCTGREALGTEVLAALRRVRRAGFVPEVEERSAWLNRPLSIGHGQTISQPFVVALMTDLLELAPEHRVLEVGTGSGYQAAVLAELAEKVFSVEIVPELAERARLALAREGYGRVHLRTGDGALGWPEEAPFDAIIVTAAAPSIPPDLVAQLRPGGRMAIPVGEPWGEQSLVLLRKEADGAVTRRTVLGVSFVPLTGERAFPRDGGTA
ncbi:MAG: protein-L-isoaspartate(D-aspartate) O-methyltransferase [Alphaproteobacteria bacterium]|nr:protein-L-isoaspartate(D-aspartate) O-methyltransferase [Alphaproteobacteria bacterium]